MKAHHSRQERLDCPLPPAATIRMHYQWEEETTRYHTGTCSVCRVPSRCCHLSLPRRTGSLWSVIRTVIPTKHEQRCWRRTRPRGRCSAVCVGGAESAGARGVGVSGVLEPAAAARADPADGILLTGPHTAHLDPRPHRQRDPPHTHRTHWASQGLPLGTQPSRLRRHRQNSQALGSNHRHLHQDTQRTHRH